MKVLCVGSRFCVLGVILQLSEGSVCWATVLYVGSGLTVMLREDPVYWVTVQYVGCNPTVE